MHEQYELMFKISHLPLPQSLLSYVAFRVVVLETLERMLFHKHYTHDISDAYGYLSEVPFLREVPAQVQLDLLAITWQKHLSRNWHSATLIDQSVIYAVCESAAGLLEADPDIFARHMRGGPLDFAVPVDAYLVCELRQLYPVLSNECDFLLLGQFLDLDPEQSAQSKIEMGINPSKLTPMFDVLGRWHVSTQFQVRLEGLLTEVEIQRVATVIGSICTRA